MLTLEFDFWIVVKEKWNEKIIPYTIVLKENKYRTSLRNIDWCNEMSERNDWFMLRFKNFWLLKSTTVCRNCAELTGINNEEIIYTLLNIFKYRCKTKETNK